MQGISVVTGTLDRKEYLPGLISNTVDSGSTVNVELVLVDGGSTDGTIEYLEQLNHPNIKLIKHGERSSYPHYMNLGVKNASYDLICQWNDDVLLINSWDQVLDQIDDEHDAYLFNWKTGSLSDMTNPNWQQCEHMRDNNWIIINNADYKYPQMIGEQRGEVVMNYGIYKKIVFKQCGMYDSRYQYYCADGEMAMRAYYNGCKFKSCISVKVLVLPADKRAIMMGTDVKRYQEDCLYYTRDI